MRTEKQNTQRPADHYTPHGVHITGTVRAFHEEARAVSSGRSIGRSHSLKRNASVSSSLTPSTSTPPTRPVRQSRPHGLSARADKPLTARWQ